VECVYGEVAAVYHRKFFIASYADAL